MREKTDTRERPTEKSTSRKRLRQEQSFGVPEDSFRVGLNGSRWFGGKRH